jgi:protein-S-isoprenylcysteine O-methyltransferase Ste14
MYLGLVCLLLAWAWALGHVWALLAPLVFVSYITRFQIVPEERAMAAHFGAAYDDYRQRVRRWL